MGYGDAERYRRARRDMYEVVRDNVAGYGRTIDSVFQILGVVVTGGSAHVAYVNLCARR
jgi:hypothetical protein